MKKLSLWLMLFSLAVLVAVAFAQDNGAGLKIEYSLDKDSEVSLNIYDENGQIVRELLHGSPRKAGQNSETWDAKDERGKPVAAGKYSWKLRSSQGLQAEYLMTLGTNPKPDYLPWPANHNGLAAIAIDEKGDNYFIGGMSEGPPLLIKQSAEPEEKRLWVIPHELQGWNGGHAMSVANGRLYYIQNNGRVQVVDASDGKSLAFWDVVWEKGEKEDGFAHFKTDIAARGDQVVRAYLDHDVVRWVDPKTGAVIDEASVPKPLGITLAPDGRVLVISQNRVLSLSRENKTPKVLISGLTRPWRLTVDSTTGDILVADSTSPELEDERLIQEGLVWGKTDQVKRFSADGKLLKILGPRANEGLYNPAGVSTILDIEEDRKGGFFIAEDIAPGRVAHFDKNWKLLREWYGGQQYANFGTANPDSPSDVWVETRWGQIMHAKVDYEKKTWKIVGNYKYQNLGDGFIAGSRQGDWLVRNHGGHTYLVRRGNPTVLMFDEKNDRLVAKVAMRSLRSWTRKAEGWAPHMSELYEHFNKISQRGQVSMLWTDRNGDGKTSMDEIQDVTGSPAVDNSSDVGMDFSYYPYNSPGGTALLIKVKEWLPNGTPVYSFDNAPIIVPLAPQFGSMGSAVVPRDQKQNDYYAAYQVPKGNNTYAFRAVRWKDGKVLWSAGRQALGTKAEPGEVKQFNHIVGVAHGNFIVADYADSMAHVWDEDGLWVGRLNDHPDLKAAPREAYDVCGENFGGGIYENPKTGNVIYFGGGCNSTPVYRVRGWGDFEKQSGTLNVSPETATQLAQNYQVEIVKAAPNASIIPFKDNVVIDGDLSEWKGIAPLKIMDGNDVRAKVYFGWNNTGLYAAFDVNTDTPWKSSANARGAFEGGAAVDVNIGPIAPQRDKPVAGDYRVVASPIANNVMEFIPILSPEMNGDWKKPETYKTGLGETTFERVENMSQTPAISKIKPDGKGYVVEMKLPVHQPLELKSRTRLKLDFSVILSNAQGDHSTARVPWHAKTFEETMTNDEWTQSLLRPQNWGEAILE